MADRLNLVAVAEFNPDLAPAALPQAFDRILEKGLLPHLPPVLAARAVLTPAPSSPASHRAARRSVAIDLLMAAVSVRNIPDSLILEVTVESASPELARRIADTLAGVYLADQARSRSDSATEAAAWLADRVEGLDRDLARAEARLKDLRQRIARAEETGEGGGTDAPRLRQLRALEARRAARHGGQAEDLARLTRLEREVAASRLIHAHFLGRLKEIAARAGAGRAESRLLAGAETPLEPGQPRPLLAVVLAATLGFLAMAARVMLAEAGRQGLRSLDELEVTGLPVLGQTLARRRFRRTTGAELAAIAPRLASAPGSETPASASRHAGAEGAGGVVPAAGARDNS